MRRNPYFYKTAKGEIKAVTDEYLLALIDHFGKGLTQPERDWIFETMKLQFHTMKNEALPQIVEEFVKVSQAPVPIAVGTNEEMGPIIDLLDTSGIPVEARGQSDGAIQHVAVMVKRAHAKNVLHFLMRETNRPLIGQHLSRLVSASEMDAEHLIGIAEGLIKGGIPTFVIATTPTRQSVVVRKQDLPRAQRLLGASSSLMKAFGMKGSQKLRFQNNAPIHDRDPGYVWFNLKIAYDKWQTAKTLGLPEKTVGHFKARAKMFIRMIEDELRIEPEESFREEYETIKARIDEDSAPGKIQLNNNPRKGRRVVNPWAVCRAMQKKHKWSEAKYERCVLQLKAKLKRERYGNNPPPFKFTPGERVNTGIASGLRSGQQAIVTRRWWDGALGTNMYEVNMLTDQKYLSFWETDLSSASPSIPMKFKIGDRVKVINPQATNYGRFGKVVNFWIDNTTKVPEYDVVLDGESVDITFMETSLALEGPKAAILPPKKPKVDVEGYQQKFVVGDLVKVRTELANSPGGYLETHVVNTGYDQMGGYFTVVLRHKGHLITYPEKHVQMVRKTTFFNNPGRAMHNPPEKRLYLRDLQQYDMDKGESEVRALEMLIDSGSGDPRLSIQFWRDVRTYGLAEAFVYLRGYEEQGLWTGDMNEVKQQVNKMLAQHGRVRRFNNNPWLVAGPQVNLYDQPGMTMAPAAGQQVPAQVTPVDVSSHPLKALPAPGNGGEPQRVRAERSPVGERERARRHRFAMRQRRDSRTGKFYDNPSQTPEIYRPNPYAYRVWSYEQSGYTDDWYKTAQSADDHQREMYLASIKGDMDYARKTGNTSEVTHLKDKYNHPENWTQDWDSEVKPVWVDSQKWKTIKFTSPYAKNPPDSSGFEKIAESKKGENGTAIYVKYDQAWQVLTVRYVEQVGKQKKGLEVEVAAYPGEAQRMWRFVKKHGFSAFLKAIKKAGRTVRAKRAYEEATTESTYKQPELFGSQHEEDDVVRFAIATADQVAHEVQERDFNQAVQNLMRLREIMIRAQERKYTGAWQQLQAQWEKARNLIEGAWPGKIKGIK